MSAWAGGAELGPDREFTYPLRWWQVAGHVLVAIMGLVYAVVCVAVGPWYRHVAGAALPWFWPLIPLGWAAVVGSHIWGIVGRVRLARHGGILVTRVGISVRDERGVEQRLFWGDVQEARVRAWLSGVEHPYGRLELRTAERRLRISPWLPRQDWEELRGLSVQFAGLTQQTRKWWGVTYTRPWRS